MGITRLELLDLAQKIEKNGELFYRKAAETYPKYSKFLLELAEQEKGHHSFFESIRKNVSADEAIRESGLNKMIKSKLDAIADGLIFDLESELKKFDCEDIEEVMDCALQREEETILFFCETKKLLTDDKDRLILGYLIEEEIRHIAWINQQIDSLPKKHPLV